MDGMDRKVKKQMKVREGNGIEFRSSRRIGV